MAVNGPAASVFSDGIHAAWSFSGMGHWPTPICRGFVFHAEASIDASSSPASNLVLPSETRGTTSWCSFICSPPTCQGTFASTVTERKPAAQAPNTNAIARGSGVELLRVVTNRRLVLLRAGHSQAAPTPERSFDGKFQ